MPVADQQAVINRMAVLRAEGGTDRAVAARLNAEGVKPPAGDTWHPTTLRKVLVREGRAEQQ